MAKPEKNRANAGGKVLIGNWYEERSKKEQKLDKLESTLEYHEVTEVNPPTSRKINTRAEYRKEKVMEMLKEAENSRPQLAPYETSSTDYNSTAKDTYAVPGFAPQTVKPSGKYDLNSQPISFWSQTADTSSKLTKIQRGQNRFAKNVGFSTPVTEYAKPERFDDVH